VSYNSCIWNGVTFYLSLVFFYFFICALFSALELSTVVCWVVLDDWAEVGHGGVVSVGWRDSFVCLGLVEVHEAKRDVREVIPHISVASRRSRNNDSLFLIKHFVLCWLLYMEQRFIFKKTTLFFFFFKGKKTTLLNTSYFKIMFTLIFLFKKKINSK